MEGNSNVLLEAKHRLDAAIEPPPSPLKRATFPDTKRKPLEYVDEPNHLDVVLGADDDDEHQNWPGTERFWNAIEQARAKSRWWNSIYAVTKASQQILSQMTLEQRRFLRWDATAGKYQVLARPDAGLEIAQAIAHDLAIQVKAAKRATIVATTILEVNEDSEWSFFGDDDDDNTDSSVLDFVPVAPFPMLFPYDIATSISDHGWRSPSSSTTLATLASEVS